MSGNHSTRHCTYEHVQATNDHRPLATTAPIDRIKKEGEFEGYSLVMLTGRTGQAHPTNNPEPLLQFRSDADSRLSDIIPPRPMLIELFTQFWKSESLSRT